MGPLRDALHFFYFFPLAREERREKVPMWHFLHDKSMQGEGGMNNAT
jgi:hypothetical protein